MDYRLVDDRLLAFPSFNGPCALGEGYDCV